LIFNVCREACINFKELWKKKHADNLWIKEVAAMQSSLPPALSLSGSSGIILANDITANDQNSIASGDGNVLSETSNSTSNKKEGNFLNYFFLLLYLDYIMYLEIYRNHTSKSNLRILNLIIRNLLT